MRINTNVSSLNAWRNLSSTDGAMSKNLERLSSGYRINRAGDDVAGLAISENMRAQIKGLNQAVKNAQDGISLLQTAEGSLNEVHSMLHRMRELAVQSANGTLQPEDRKQIQTEMDNLTKEVTRITNATQFNSMDLVDGSLTKQGIRDVNLQIGPNGGQTLAFEIGAMDAKSLGISRDVTTAQVFQADLTNGVVNTGTASIVASVDATGATGAGLASGLYRVEYDNTTKRVQLKNMDGTNIGDAVDATNGGTVTIGDANTAQTITLKLDGAVNSLSAVTTDLISVGSKVGTVNDDFATTQDIIQTSLTYNATTDAMTASTGVQEVGWGLTGGQYTVKTVDTDGDLTFESIQLFDAAGTGAIGRAVDASAGGSIEIGDATTGRTVKLDVIAQSGAASTSDVIDVTNNNEFGMEAQFNGNAKRANAQTFAGLNVSSVKGAQDAIKAIDDAIGKVSYQRSQLGAITNRLEHTVSNLQVVSENLTASESRIRDVDMAMEMTQFTKQQILMQSGTAMLAQANQKNQAVLSLLR